MTAETTRPDAMLPCTAGALMLAAAWMPWLSATGSVQVPEMEPIPGMPSLTMPVVISAWSGTWTVAGLVVPLWSLALAGAAAAAVEAARVSILPRLSVGVPMVLGLCAAVPSVILLCGACGRNSEEVRIGLGLLLMVAASVYLGLRCTWRFWHGSAEQWRVAAAEARLAARASRPAPRRQPPPPVRPASAPGGEQQLGPPAS